MKGDTITTLLETFQECVGKGEQARLFLETRNGEQFANLSVKVPVVKPGTFQTNMSRSSNRKSPSTIRRDQNRLKNYLQRKMSNETWNPGKTSTPAKDLSQPDLACSSQSVEVPTLIEESSREETKLEKDEISEKETKENMHDCNNEKKEWDFKNKDFMEDFIEIVKESVTRHCKESIGKTFGEMNKQLQEINKELTVTSDNEQHNLEEVNGDDNVDNIEEAKLWAVQQKQSCFKT